MTFPLWVSCLYKPFPVAAGGGFLIDLCAILILNPLAAPLPILAGVATAVQGTGLRYWVGVQRPLIFCAPGFGLGRFLFAYLCILPDSSVCSGPDQQRSAPDPAPISRFESFFFRHSAQSGHTVFECCRTVRQHHAPFESSQFATTPFLCLSEIRTSSLYAAPVSKFWTLVAIFANCENGTCLLCSCPQCGQL